MPSTVFGSSDVGDRPDVRAAMALPEYDESRWPIVVIRLPGTEMSDEEFDLHLARIEAYLARGTPIVMVFGEGAAPSMSPSQRRKMAARMKHDLAAHPGILAGIGHVGSSPTLRSLGAAIAWLVPTPYPIRSFAERDAALAWASRRLADFRARKGL